MEDRTRIEELTARQLADAISVSSTVEEVLDRVGYSSSGQMRKKLKARAAELGVELPGQRVRGSKNRLETTSDVSLDGAETVLPSKTEQLNSPRPIEARVNQKYLDIIDQLGVEIEELEAEIEKRRRVQNGLKALVV